MRNYYGWLFVSVCAASVLHPISAAAEAAPAQTAPPQIAEVTVTAEKRESSLQTTPIAIEVVAGAALEERMITNIEGLAATLPNVQFGANTGQARVSLRSLGTDVVGQGNEGRIAFHQDGVYLGHPEAQLLGFYDIERIEVLYGPQGTLYGRNATGGAINVITRAPTHDLNGYLHGEFGNYRATHFEGAVGGSILPGVDGRLAFMTDDHAGYGRNLFNGMGVDDNHTKSVRGKLRFDLGSHADLTVAADYMRERDRANGYRLVGQAGLTPGAPPLKGLLYGGITTTDGWDVATDSGPYDRRSFGGGTADLHVYLGEFNLRSITAYRTQDVSLQTDLDQTTADLSQAYVTANAHTWSQELQLSRDFSRGSWMLGAFYYNDKFFGGTNLIAPPAFLRPFPASLALTQGFTLTGYLGTEAYAGFVNLRYELTDALTLRAGVRYSSETKSVNEINVVDIVTPWPPTEPFGSPCHPTDFACKHQTTSKSFASLKPSATLEYQPAERLMLYLTYATGFKSGGYNLGSAQAPYNPEDIRDYEGGLKSAWLGGRIRLNAAMFYYKYRNLQLSKNFGTVVQVVNASAATVKGAELNISALPTTNLKLETNVGLLDSKYDSFVTVDAARPSLGPLDLAGNHLTQAPRYTINLAAEYNIPIPSGSVTFRAEERLIDKVYFTPYNLNNQSQSAYTKTNLFLRYKAADDHWNGALFVRNLESRRIKTNTNVSSVLLGYPILGGFEAPRTFGIQIGYDF